MARRRRQRGSGSLFFRQGSWAVRWEEGGRRRYKGGFASREDAQRVLDKIRGEVALGRAGLPPDVRGVPPLGELAQPFLERRELTHRTHAEDRLRWNKHLRPHFGKLRPHEVDAGRILAFVERKRAERLNPATIRILVSILSGLFNRLRHDKLALSNPCRDLPEDVRALMRSTHDPETVPFVEKLDDVRRIYLELPPPFNVAYAIGAMAGLRTGEVFALRWQHVDLAARRIHVRESVKGPLKDKKARVVPILDGLLPVLTEWKLRTGGGGRVIPPLRRDGEKVDKHTPGRRLRPVLAKLGLHEAATYRDAWYSATRHTFASQWVLGGGSIEKLSKVMGHYSVVMTERYSHLRTDLFSERDRGTIALDLRPAGEVVPLSSPAAGEEEASRDASVGH